MSVSVASCRRLCYPSIKGDDTMPTPQEVWAMLQAHEGETFYTAKGLPFHYLIHGRELFVNRKNKSITISTVANALARIKAREAAGHHPSAAGKRRTTAINCRRITGCITCYALFACFVQKSAKMSKAYIFASYK